MSSTTWNEILAVRAEIYVFIASDLEDNLHDINPLFETMQLMMCKLKALPSTLRMACSNAMCARVEVCEIPKL